MIDHLELQSRKVDLAARFYTDVLEPLGYERKMDGAVKGFGVGQALDLFIIEGEPSRDVHFAFATPSRSVVDAIWAIAAKQGHQTDRAPALAPHVHPNYYAGYLRDPDGRLVEFVCHAAE